MTRSTTAEAHSAWRTTAEYLYTRQQIEYIFIHFVTQQFWCLNTLSPFQGAASLAVPEMYPTNSDCPQYPGMIALGCLLCVPLATQWFSFRRRENKAAPFTLPSMSVKQAPVRKNVSPNPGKLSNCNDSSATVLGQLPGCVLKSLGHFSLFSPEKADKSALPLQSTWESEGQHYLQQG